MIKIITTKKEWEFALGRVGHFDFYHSYDYHQISRTDMEEPVLLSFEDEHGLFLLPLLLRRVFDSESYDATSVYGYCGPLRSKTNTPINPTNFQNALRNYFREKQIIAVFSRLNPYMANQEEILKGMGEVRFIGNVVNIDLTRTLDQQRSAYRRDSRSRVNKARRLCSVRRANSPEDVEVFIDIYTETMKKLEADKSYFFDKEYFFDFINCDGFETEILLAIHNETSDVTAGSMFVKTKDIVQYHLSGTRHDYMNLAPSRLLLDEMRIKATAQGYRYFNLGGGFKGKEDPLFNFKSSFSDDIRAFKVWNYIANPEKYREFTNLVKDEEVTDFFPAYRA